KSVFIYGQFAAALIRSLAVIEHCIVEALQDRGLVTESRGLSKSLSLAVCSNVRPGDWKAPIEILAKRRNSYAHFKDDENDNAISKRMRAQMTHPRLIMEADAKEAITWMFKVFNATLHEAA